MFSYLVSLSYCSFLLSFTCSFCLTSFLFPHFTFLDPSLYTLSLSSIYWCIFVLLLSSFRSFSYYFFPFVDWQQRIFSRYVGLAFVTAKIVSTFTGQGTTQGLVKVPYSSNWEVLHFGEEKGWYGLANISGVFPLLQVQLQDIFSLQIDFAIDLYCIWNWQHLCMVSCILLLFRKWEETEYRNKNSQKSLRKDVLSTQFLPILRLPANVTFCSFFNLFHFVHFCSFFDFEKCAFDCNSSRACIRIHLQDIPPFQIFQQRLSCNAAEIGKMHLQMLGCLNVVTGYG